MTPTLWYVLFSTLEQEHILIACDCVTSLWSLEFRIVHACDINHVVLAVGVGSVHLSGLRHIHR